MQTRDAILITDDNPENLRVLSDILEPGGYEVRVATTGEQALDSIEAAAPDLVLLDIQLPKLDGYEVCRRIRARWKNRILPVIFVSAATEAYHKKMAFEAGGDDYMTKPFQAEELLARVRTHLNAARYLRQLKDSNIVLSKKLQHFFDQAIVGIAYADPKTRRFTDVNQPFCDMLGYTREELLEKTFLDIAHPDFVESGRHLTRELQEGKMERASVERKYLRKDGSTMWGSATISFVRFGKTEIDDCFAAILEDITERKESAVARRESEEKFRALAEQNLDVIMRFDNQHRHLYVNPAVEKGTGRKPEWFIGRTHEELGFPADLCEMWEAAISEVFRTKAVNRIEFQLPSGEWIDWLLMPEYDDSGGVNAVITSARDITERKRAEADRLELEAQFHQAQKMEAVGRLAGGVAHDFNNLLMGIMNYADLCRDEIEHDHPAREWLDEILAESHRSATIVRQLLAFARKETIAPQVLDLNESVAGMLKILRQLIGEDVELLWSPGADVWPVKMDPGHVDQLLANLCVNARDAIEGPGTVTVATANTVLEAHRDMLLPADSGDYAVLEISDTGCGMEQDTLARMFEPFFTTKEVGKGTGLGLATVHGIIKQCRGGLDVTSVPGVGTSFRIYLPRTAPTGGDSERDNEKGAELPHGTETVLLVEDKKALLVTCQLFLEALGYTVLTAEVPEKALQLSDEYSGRIHLLITDMVMPGMTGHDLADRLIRLRPELKCLFVSGYTADVIADRVTRETAVAFLNKPFTRDELVREIRRILDE